FLALGFTTFADPLVAWLGPKATPDTAALSTLQEVGTTVWGVAVDLLVGASIIVVSFILALVASSIVCDPFFDAISERTEALHTGVDVGPPFSLAGMLRGIGRELVATVLRLAVYAAVAIPLWLVSFTPAALVATPLALVWTWLFLSWEFVSRAFVRHAHGVGQRFRVLFAHKAVFVGFGGVAWLMAFVPFTTPLLVAGATRLYLSLAVHGHVPSTLTDEQRALLRA
ncbi:MAG TPA: EI24 domain-containing protein, partial [Myxococcota bacterium]